MVLLVSCVGLGGAAAWFVLRPHDEVTQARSLMAAGDLRAASLALRSAVLADPGRAEAHYRLGLVQLQLGDAVAAEKELRAARDRGWDAAAVRGPLADALLDQRRYEDVLHDFTADGLPPAPASTMLVARSAAELGLGHAEAARAEATRARALAPESVEAALALGMAARAGGDLKAAAAAVTEALARDPKAAHALLLDAELRGARGDPAGALAALDHAVAAAPLWSQARLERPQLLLAMHDDARARADLDWLLQQDPHAPGPRFLLAQVLVRAKDYRGADAALDRVGPALPLLPRGELLQAIVKAGLNQPEQAMDAASRHLGHHPDDPGAAVLVARLALAAGRPGQAIEVLEGAARAGHADAGVLTLLSQARSAAGQPAEAVRVMQQVAALAPDDPGALARLGRLRLDAGDAPAAERDLEHALDLVPAGAADGGTPVVAASAVPVSTSATALVTREPGSTEPAETAAVLVLAALRAGEPDHAAAALERLRTLGGQPALLASLDGAVKLARLDFDGALEALREAARLEPHAVAPTLELARLLVLRGRAAEAEALLADALAAAPLQRDLLSAAVAILLADGQAARAEQTLRAAHEAAPADPAIAIGLADLYGRTGQPARAVDLLDQVERAPAGAAPAPDPVTGAQTAESLRLSLKAARIRALLAAHDGAGALAILRDLVAARPDDLALRQQFVALALAQGELDAAGAAIQDGLARAPGTAALLGAAVAVASRAGGLQAGLDRADQLAREPAQLPAALLLKGDLYRSQGKPREAAAAYRAGLRDGSPEILATRAAEALAAAGDPAAAAALLRDRLATHPAAADVAQLLASLDIAAHRLDDARAHLRITLVAQPQNAAALNDLAWVEQRRRDPETARALARKAWLLGPGPQTADTLGDILLDAGENGPALDLLRLAAASLKGDASVQFHYARALQRAGQRDAAAAVLKAVDASGATFDEQDQAKALLASLSHP